MRETIAKKNYEIKELKLLFDKKVTAIEESYQAHFRKKNNQIEDLCLEIARLNGQIEVYREVLGMNSEHIIEGIEDANK